VPFFEGKFESKKRVQYVKGLLDEVGLGKDRLEMVQHEFGPGSTICRGRQGDDGENSGLRALPAKRKK